MSATRPFSRREVAFLVAIPLAWGLLLLLHPSGDASSIYADIHDEVTEMLVVHVGTLFFIPLMAAAVYVLTRDLESTAARVSRIALIPFVLFYGAWEILQGIGVGTLVDEVNGMPELSEAARADVVQNFAESPLVRDLGVFAVPGSLALIVALIAAGMALRREAGAPLSVAILLGISGWLITAHPPPFGPTGLALFIVAVLLLARSQRAPEPMPAGRPRPA
jgi:hypothetical protein